MKKFLLLFLILLTSCVNSGKITDVDNYYYGNNEGIDFVILQYEPNNQFYQNLFKNGVPADLTEIDIENINKILQEAINNYNNSEKTWKNDIDLSKYNRQYVAIVNENGEKEVFVNCFRSEDIRKKEHWKNGLIFVVDGGNKFFNIKINLTKLSYYELKVNGYT
jgi:hypothetical protein